ncbi:MAG: hypothetical protein J5879_07265 [Clostridia bacterium]|nr:hypothetical protein [Clostridia bacterium]
MAVAKFYDDIDIIINEMIEYLGVEEEDDYFDDLFDDDGIEEEDDDLIDDTVCTMEDVDKCSAILEKYIDDLTTISKKPDDAAIMKAVENTVKKLNKLNEACECELIESTISDDICDFIHNAAVEAGLSEIPENVCDEWREF